MAQTAFFKAILKLSYITMEQNAANIDFSSRTSPFERCNWSLTLSFHQKVAQIKGYRKVLQLSQKVKLSKKHSSFFRRREKQSK